MQSHRKKQSQKGKNTEGNGHRKESHRKKQSQKTSRRKKVPEKETVGDGRVSILVAGSVQYLVTLQSHFYFRGRRNI